MTQNQENMPMKNEYTVVTAGSTYLDIDAYACCIAMRELLELQGKRAVAWSSARANYSVCPSLTEGGGILTVLPDELAPEDAKYIVVDVSDPDYIKESVPLGQVAEVYDHHVGFEAYWQERIGEGARIEFIGAAATLIYREWKACGLIHRMTARTARLLIAAILDNTLNLTSSNTTAEDKEAFEALCRRAGVTSAWCGEYFSEVQTQVEADLRNALFGDLKRLKDWTVLPPRIAQLCVWDTQRILTRLPELRQWLREGEGCWMINVIDLQHRCSHFLCDDEFYQKEIERIFGVAFEGGVARSEVSYLRKEIIKKACYTH
jgi:inorganic pyrophosphatase/manganese-dependent inorganic pyrophosphatase